MPAGLLAAAVLAGAAASPLLEWWVAKVLGVERRRAAAMLATARLRLPAPNYAARAASFVAATSPPARFLPARIRQRPVRSLVGKLLERPDDVLFYLGRLPDAPAGPCRGLAEG